MNPRLPRLPKVIQSAKRRRLFVLLSGSGHNLKYEFFDRKSGRVVVTYYPKSKRWLGVGEASGVAVTYEDALSAALGPAPAREPRQNRAGRPQRPDPSHG